MIRKEKKNLVEKHTLQFKKSLNQKYIRTPLAPCAEKFQMIYLYFDKTKTSPSVSHAKDWLGQLFLIPGLEKCIIYGCDHFGTVNNQPNNRVILVQAS